MGNGKQGGEVEERLSRDLKRPREDWRGWRGNRMCRTEEQPQVRVLEPVEGMQLSVGISNGLLQALQFNQDSLRTQSKAKHRLKKAGWNHVISIAL